MRKNTASRTPKIQIYSTAYREWVTLTPSSSTQPADTEVQGQHVNTTESPSRHPGLVDSPPQGRDNRYRSRPDEAVGMTSSRNRRIHFKKDPDMLKIQTEITEWSCKATPRASTTTPNVTTLEGKTSLILGRTVRRRRRALRPRGKP